MDEARPWLKSPSPGSRRCFGPTHGVRHEGANGLPARLVLRMKGSEARDGLREGWGWDWGWWEQWGREWGRSL